MGFLSVKVKMKAMQFLLITIRFLNVCLYHSISIDKRNEINIFAHTNDSIDIGNGFCRLTILHHTLTSSAQDQRH